MCRGNAPSDIGKVDFVWLTLSSWRTIDCGKGIEQGKGQLPIMSPCPRHMGILQHENSNEFP